MWSNYQLEIKLFILKIIFNKIVYTIVSHDWDNEDKRSVKLTNQVVKVYDFLKLE